MWDNVPICDHAGVIVDEELGTERLCHSETSLEFPIINLNAPLTAVCCGSDTLCCTVGCNDLWLSTVILYEGYREIQANFCGTPKAYELAYKQIS